jgi:UrcA family protein
MKNQTLSCSLAAVLVSGATFLAAGAPAIAEAAPEKEAFAFQFAYTPSELNDEVAASRMLTRLQGEVRKHCTVDARQVIDRNTRVCIEATMTNVVKQIGSTTLASAHAERMG